jgi:GTP:adenosylcobinamide-phosphate guanylyltransferase
MQCEMIKTKSVITGGGSGGIHRTPAREMIVRRNAAVGDALCATIVADKLIDQGFDVVFQTHSACHCVIRRHPRIIRVEEPQTYTDVQLDNAYELNPSRRRMHFHDMFIGKANEQLGRLGINLGEARNCKPVIRVTPVERPYALEKFKEYPKPWVFICPRSDTYACRQVPDGIWFEAAKRINGTKFWLGRHPAPNGIVDLKCQHLDNVILWLSVADLLVTVDTGPMHIGAALGVPIVALGQSSSPELHLNDQNDFITICPKLDCLNCQQNICPLNAAEPPCQKFDPQFIADWANAKLGQIYSERISAVVTIWKPEVGVLNRCLECLLPQVTEIVVAMEANSILPPGALQNERIRYVRKPLANIGYGRNCQHAFRQTTGKYVVVMNDDVFLEPDAVAKMMECMKPGVGMVANRLMYPDGTVYHAGKRRGPGIRGWGHINHKQRHWEITEPTEMENVCGACILVRRQAHFDCGCFDEDYHLFGEDDDHCLRMRRAGWKIIFTPHSFGTHLEHQSVQKVGDVMALVNGANATFHRKWGRYLDHNLYTIPGNYNY